MNKKNFYMWIAIGMLFLTTITFAYAYFNLSIVGEGKDNVVESGTMKINYIDGAEVIGKDLIPGEIVTKTFTVENTGTLDVTFDLYAKNLINTMRKKS